MSPAAADVLSSAMALPEAERMDVANALLESADWPGGPTGDEWLAELRRRMAEADAGTAVFTPWEIARARVHQRVMGRADG